MAGQLKEVRNRIKSVQSTQQITKAMKMVSAAKLRRAQDAITQMRPYAEKLQEMLSNMIPHRRKKRKMTVAQAREHLQRVVVAGKHVRLHPLLRAGKCGEAEAIAPRIGLKWRPRQRGKVSGIAAGQRQQHCLAIRRAARHRPNLVHRPRERHRAAPGHEAKGGPETGDAIEGGRNLNRAPGFRTNGQRHAPGRDSRA